MPGTENNCASEEGLDLAFPGVTPGTGFLKNIWQQQGWGKWDKKEEFREEMFLYTLDMQKMGNNTSFSNEKYSVTRVIQGTSNLSSLSSIHEKILFLNLNPPTKETGTNTFLNTNIWDCVYEQSNIQLIVYT